jgi:hypothetical protein
VLDEEDEELLEELKLVSSAALGPKSLKTVLLSAKSLLPT